MSCLLFVVNPKSSDNLMKHLNTNLKSHRRHQNLAVRAAPVAVVEEVVEEEEVVGTTMVEEVAEVAGKDLKTAK